MKTKSAITAVAFLMMVLHATAQLTGTLTDKRDGKVYKTIDIGTQTWMAENMAYKAATGCWAYNKDPKNVAQYGYLYNYKTATGVCPTGWHLANDKDWETLANYLGGVNAAGGKMKTTTGWTPNYNKSESNGTNSSGFNGLPGGYYRSSGAEYSSMSSLGAFWTATMSEDDLGMTVWSYLLGSSGTRLTKDHIVFTENDGLSVRCVSNKAVVKEVKPVSAAAFPKGCKVRVIKDESPFDTFNAVMDEQYGPPTTGTVIDDLKPEGDGWYSGSVNMDKGGYRTFKKTRFELVK